MAYYSFVKKQTISIFIVIALCLLPTLPAYAQTVQSAKTDVAGAETSETPVPPQLDEPSGILIDASTGEVLWEKNADQHRAIASTTKIMTAILAIESDRLEDTVTVNSDVIPATRWGIKLVPSEEIKLRTLLYALMLPSANDSAIAIADKIGGSVDNFVKMMNVKAINLGAENTYYVNPHGLPGEGHPYSTARDLALVTRYALKNKVFAEIVMTKTMKLGRTIPKVENAVENTNKLLWQYPGMIGVKTGHTNEAGFCLVSGAQRDDVSLIGVLLGAKGPDIQFCDSARLLDYGFSLYEKQRVVSQKKVYKVFRLDYGQKIVLVPASDLDVLIRRSSTISVKVLSQPSPSLPVKKGTRLGTIVVSQNGRILANTALVAKAEVKDATFSQILGYYWSRVVSSIF
ncbi:MAG TPA: D-alanyl-D-alanine carboxypeptidase family protein [Candidatus Aquicultor sp.]